jgi:hypothetical protein
MSTGKPATHVSYRAVGSGTAADELLAAAVAGTWDASRTAAFTVLGAPLPAANYMALMGVAPTGGGGSAGVLTVPLLAAKIGVWHSLLAPDGRRQVGRSAHRLHDCVQHGCTLMHVLSLTCPSFRP